MDGENHGKTLSKWMIWGYHHFRKPPYIYDTRRFRCSHAYMSITPWVILIHSPTMSGSSPISELRVLRRSHQGKFTKEILKASSNPNLLKDKSIGRYSGQGWVAKNPVKHSQSRAMKIAISNIKSQLFAGSTISSYTISCGISFHQDLATLQFWKAAFFLLVGGADEQSGRDEFS